MRSVLILFISLFSLNILAITPKEAYEMVKSGNAVIIDVREKNEIASGMIDIAKWLPLSTIEENTSWLNTYDKLTQGKQVFLYCRSGRRSEKVMMKLKENQRESKNLGGYMDLQKELPTRKP